jgi:hypothetical protein
MTTNSTAGTYLDAQSKVERLDLTTEARKYVESVNFDESLLSRRDELVRVGQRIIQAFRDTSDQDDGEVEVNHKDFLDKSYQGVSTSSSSGLVGAITNTFVAKIPPEMGRMAFVLKYISHVKIKRCSLTPTK